MNKSPSRSNELLPISPPPNAKGKLGEKRDT
jgi:hypothetical protein